MPKIKNTFVAGKMDKDTSKSLIIPNSHFHAENLRFHINDGGDGIGKSTKGTTEVGNATTGVMTPSAFKCVGAYHDKKKNVIYYMLATSTGLVSRLVEYNIVSGATVIVSEDSLGIYNFDFNGYITGINIIDDLLLFSEWGNNPRRVNIPRAKGYGLNGFTEDDIALIVKPPIYKPRITLQTTGSPTQEENFIEEKFPYFGYRWRYLDGEYSTLSPFTLPAFFPKTFAYDFSEQSNPSMVNKFNSVLIEFDTGNERVTEIQLIFKESQSNTEWIIDDFDKAKLGYGNNQKKTFEFFNDKRLRVLSDTVLREYYHNVPLTNKSQAMIDGRIIIGYYKEQFNIIDDVSANIEIDYTLDLIATDNTIVVDGEVVASLIPKQTIKSIRDYEVAVVYLDEYGRATPPLLSKNSTIYIPVLNSVTENQIQVTLNNKPPVFAKHFRFFIKMNKKHYDQIIPNLFYEDGVFRWIKLEGADKDKVKEGDYLIVKSDSQTKLTSLVKTKVLEVTTKEQNFLQAEDIVDEIHEQQGLYCKVKEEFFRLDQGDLDFYELNTYDDSADSHSFPIRQMAPYTSKAHFYGDTLDDMTSSGTYTGNLDDRNRYVIQIQTQGPIDTFRWSDDNGATFPPAQSNIPITTAFQPLNRGIFVQFDAFTGHSTIDEWTINARQVFFIDDAHKAVGFFRTVNFYNEPLVDPEDEIIYSGANMELIYDEYDKATRAFTINNQPNGTYDDIEEWYHKEGIEAEILGQVAGFTPLNIHFVRGVIKADGSATQITQENNTGTMTMIVISFGTQSGQLRPLVRVRATSRISQIASPFHVICFETDPIEEPTDEFFEIGLTYDIENGFHRTAYNVSETILFPNDQDQTGGQPLKATLDFFNAFSYGNAVESYKIKDEFNRKAMDTGIRVLTKSKEEYKEVIRTADLQWSDVYQDDTNFNGLNAFNLGQTNFATLDKENGTIQKLHNFGSNILVFQEDAIGIMPYNKNVIQDIAGGKAIIISDNILDKKSYRPYAGGLHGISKNPEGFVPVGLRFYLPDKKRGDILRLANDGITEINQNGLEHYMSNEMVSNQDNFLVGAWDPKHKEYLLNFPDPAYLTEEAFSDVATLSFKEKVLGFPNYFTYKPDFILGADNELYGWKDGVMYKHHASTTRNNFYGTQYESKIRFYANHELGVEKVFKAMGIQSTHAWDASLKTKLTSRLIAKEDFVKITDSWFSDIMGNTNGTVIANSTFGLGTYRITNGVFTVKEVPSVMSVGDTILSAGGVFALAPAIVQSINGLIITLDKPINQDLSFLMYSKNQNVDGGAIRGDWLEIELTNDSTEQVELISVTVEAVKDNYS